jgi:hypothetical protein
VTQRIRIRTAAISAVILGAGVAAVPLLTSTSDASSTSAAATPLAAAPAPRLLPNPGFENGLTGWTVDPATANVTVVTSPTHSGAQAAQISDQLTGSTGGVRFASGRVAVVPGEDLTGTIWAQRTAGNGGGFFLEFWRADGNRASVYSVPVTSTTGWQQLTVSGTAPDDAVSASLLAYSAQAEQGTTLWDDAALTATPPGLHKVPNAGFEEKRNNVNPTEWTLDESGGNVFFAPSGTAHTGTMAIEVKDTSTSDRVMAGSKAIPVAKNEVITASAWAYRVSGTTASIYLEFKDKTGAQVGVQSVTVPSVSGWQKVSVTGTAPATATTFDVLLYSNVPGTSDTRWDDVSIHSSSDPAYDPALGADQTVLFVGDQRVESYTGVTHKLVPGTKDPTNYGKVLTGGSGAPAYDANPRMSGTVLLGGPGEPKYKMWYKATDATGYVTSDDGITWSRNGRTTPVDDGSAGVVENPNWSAGSSVPRYFSFTGTTGPKYTPVQSTDGINWVQVPGADSIPGFDVIVVTYDPVKHIYLAMSKHQITAPWGPRSMWLSTSTDFVHWSVPTPSFAADLLDDSSIPAGYGLHGQTAWDEIYGMPATRYGDQYLGTPWVFDIEYSPDRDTGNPGVDHGRSHLEIAASQDAINWSRPDRTNIVTPGPKPATTNPAPESWDYGFALGSTTFVNVQLPNGDWQTRFYYGAFAGDHTCDPQSLIDAGDCRVKYGNSNIGLVTWPMDRFEAFHANAGQTGSVTTKPLSPAASTLSVNYDPGTSGSLRVAVLDANGTPVPGYDATDSAVITTDSRHPGVPLSWGGKTTLPTNAGPLRLRFDLTGGDLYAFAVK